MKNGLIRRITTCAAVVGLFALSAVGLDVLRAEAWHVVSATASCSEHVGDFHIHVVLSDNGPGSYGDGDVTGRFNHTKVIDYDIVHPSGTVTVHWDEGESSHLNYDTEELQCTPQTTTTTTLAPTTTTTESPTSTSTTTLPKETTTVPQETTSTVTLPTSTTSTVPSPTSTLPKQTTTTAGQHSTTTSNVPVTGTPRRTPPTSPGSLASTGNNPAWLVLAAFLCLVIGVLGIVAGDKDREALRRKLS